jgi:iron complex outermembrane recepter protein
MLIKNISPALAALTACVCFILPRPSSAQTSVTPGHNRRDSVRKYESKEVIVSTAGRGQKLIDVPVSISAVPSEYFRESRAYNVKDALSYVPGVFAQSRAGHTDARITIRGFGSRGATDRSNAGTTRGVRILLDGLPETEPDGRTALDLVDLNAISSVEVLRGNGSYVYGSASGGVVNFLSGADISTPLVETKNTFGQFGLARNTLDASATMGVSRLFVAATRTTYDGYRAHSAAKGGNVTMSLRSDLTEDTRLALSLVGGSNIARYPGALTKQQVETDPTQSDSLYLARDEHRFNRMGRIGVSLQHDLTDNQTISGTLYLMPKVQTRSERGTWREFNRYTVGSMATYGLTGQITESIGNSLTVGYEQQYQDGSILFYNLTPAAGRGTLRDNKREAASNVGFFANDLITFGAFDVLLGARFTDIQYTAENFFSNLPKETLDFTLLSPRIALGYHLASNRTAYASFGQGIEAPAFNEVDRPGDSAAYVSRGGVWNGSIFNVLLEPAVSTTIELGFKGYEQFDGFVNGLSYDIAGFLINTKNDFVPWNGGGFYFTAAKTKRTGVEIGLTASTEIGLSLRSATTLMSSEYVDYVSNLGDFSGNKMAGVPGLFGTTALRYDSPIGIFVELDVEYVGEYYADDRNDKLGDGNPDPATNSLVESYVIENGTIGFKTALGSFDLDLFAGLRNLTDTKYVGSVFINGANNKYFEPGMPRNFIAGLNLRYRISD